MISGMPDMNTSLLLREGLIQLLDAATDFLHRVFFRGTPGYEGRHRLVGDGTGQLVAAR